MTRNALLPLLALAFTSACAPGVPAPAPPASLEVALRLAPAGAYPLASVMAPYRASDVARVRLDLALAGSGAVVASHEVGPDGLAGTVTFAPLAAETTYRLTGHALDAGGTEISDPAASGLTLAIGRETAPAPLATLTVKLADRQVRLRRMEAPVALLDPTGWPAVQPPFWTALGDDPPDDGTGVSAPGTPPALTPVPEALAYNGRRGHYLALHAEADGLVARPAAPDGTWLEEAFRLGAEGAAPALAHNQAVDEYVAVWETPAGGIAARRLKGDGRPNGPVFALDAAGERPAIAYHPALNRYLVAWERPALGGGSAVYALRLDSSLAP